MKTIINIMKYALLFSLISNNIFSQISFGGEPYSFKHSTQKSIQIKEMGKFDVESLLREDEKSFKDEPYRFGYGFDVNYNLYNSGNWVELDNGRLWKLQIKSEGAHSINLLYDKFWLPDSAKLFIYNVDKSMVIGAFTSRNNKPHGKFATGLVKGEEIILEYYEPKNVKKKGEVSISRIIHGYRNLFNFNDTKLGKIQGFGNSESCNNNVYCSEASIWENEVHSVGMIVLDDGTRLCTGALINNVNGNYAPYFLTANHCLSGDVNTWVIWFNYESSTCSNPSSQPLASTLSGATLKSSNFDTDFALIILDETPPLDYNVFYSGWSKLNIAPTSSVGIHHPSGDIKKISYDNDLAISNDYDDYDYDYPDDSHWKVRFDDGTVEHGSSGSPLFDQNHRIVGQLHGDPNYTGTMSYCDQRRGEYGKFSMSWNYGSTSSSRLRDWLDPNNTGASTLNGMVDGMLASGALPVSATWSGTHTLYGNVSVPTNVNLTIKSGSTINLNGYNIYATGGVITVETGIHGNCAILRTANSILAIYPTIQQAIDLAGQQYTVELVDHTYNESFSIVNKYMRYLVGASTGNTIINGNITITNSSYSSVSDLSMANGKTITINGGTQSKLSNIASTSGSSAINVYDGLGTEISNSNYISNEAQAPAWSFYNTNSGGLMSDVIEGYMFGIYANSGSDISLNAPLFCNNMIDLYANGSTTSIYAREYVLSYEGATIGDVTLVDGNGVCGSGGIFKSNIAQNAQVVNDNLKEANSAFRALLVDEDISKSVTLSEESKRKIKAVITKYKNALLIDLSQSEINEALRKLSSCYKMLDEVAVFADYVSSLISNKSVLKEMERFLVPNLVGKGNYNEAISLIDEILTYKDISQDLEYELLYEKGTIQKYYIEESELAEKVFLDLYKKAGDHVLAKYAKAQLENQSGLDDGNKPINDDNLESNENYEISSYPNPFNPTTTIAYQIPKDGFVSLVVYNTLGQVVSTLVNEHKTSGKYSVQFNANNLPSGVYFYKIVADSYGESGNFTKVNKMLLLR